MSLSDLPQKRKLIDIVEVNPDLWKLTKKAPNLKQKLWNNVGAELGTSGFDARRQWEILRDQFRREYKRFTFDRSYKSKWIFYNRMLFVRHALRPRDGQVCQNNSENEEQSCEEHQPLEVEVDVAQMLDMQSEIDNLVPKIQVRQDLQEGNDSSQSQVTLYEQGEEGEPSTSAGVSSSCQRPQYDEGDFSSSSSRKRRRWRVESPDEDEDYHFVMSILPSLRSIQHTKKLRVRSKIMDLLATELDADFEAETQLQLPLLQELKTADSEQEDKFLLIVPPNQM